MLSARRRTPARQRRGSRTRANHNARADRADARRRDFPGELWWWRRQDETHLRVLYLRPRTFRSPNHAAAACTKVSGGSRQRRHAAFRRGEGYALAPPGERAKPGMQAVLCKLSELLFVEAVRSHVDALHDPSSGWLAGLKDRYVSAALALIHGEPGRPWTLEHSRRGAAARRGLHSPSGLSASWARHRCNTFGSGGFTSQLTLLHRPIAA